ncbi:ABC transporter substrate-binding protein [Arthrobacter sp. MSA 4-2]|uniref:ABC transporter substrate-binding protein n=1 Tax=Arthrobacter sp. MSA 4-2 TaxID=2794349 RepID=UPI0018E7F514|nr:ABC transporter substrate-binding protein [Arthrobacter sp. MSA 4-2]MBJ2121776.1 ABC transporter substrate-binding protein [Arthrobacter sp. MSA 4-2]
MPEAVDVGSVLGGRYKVTAYVLASADKDLVLDGVDQVLNRPVSILVASPANAGQVAASAREVATGERPGSIQVLDLGITEGGTYLVTNRASAADLLDLIVQQDAPYIEPFFTDTLGSEIFGVARSTEPETYDEDHYEETEHVERRSPFANLSKKFGRPAAGATAEDAQPVTAGGAGTAEQRAVGTESIPKASRPVPPAPAMPPAGSPEPSRGSAGRDSRRQEDPNPKVTRLPSEPEASGSGRTIGAALGASALGASAAAGRPERAPSRFPASPPADADDRDEYEDDRPEGNRKFTRILVGAVLSLLLIIAVVLAATTIGGLSNPTANDDPTTTGGETQGAESTPPSGAATESAEPAAETVPPVITGVTRLVPSNQNLDAPNDANLPLTVDNNPATFWGSYVYANDVFGGLAQSLALVVELEEESTISEVKIDQLNGTGGNFSVLLNDAPTLEGAEQIAQGGFTGPSITTPVPEGDDGPATARYVIVNFTQLPRLSNIQAQFPWGLRIAEIGVS